jgi:hypothetical protein
VGRPHRRTHRARVPEPRRHRCPAREDEIRRRPRPVQLHLRVQGGGSRARGGSDGRRPRQPPRRARRSGAFLRLRERARAADPARRAPGLRAVDPGAHRRSGQPRHPVHPARPALARPVRPRRPPATHPGDDDLEDERDRRRHRGRQEPDQSIARQRRAAGAACRCRDDRRRGRSRREAPRFPVRRQAARRQPRPRCPPRPALRGAGPCRLPGGAGAEPIRGRDGRDVRRRQRLPLPGHRREGRGDRRARPGECDR